MTSGRCLKKHRVMYGCYTCFYIQPAKWSVTFSSFLRHGNKQVIYGEVEAVRGG